MEIATPTVRHLPGSGVGICALLDFVTSGKRGGGEGFAAVARTFTGVFCTADRRAECGSRGEQSEAEEKGRPSTHLESVASLGYGAPLLRS